MKTWNRLHTLAVPLLLALVFSAFAVRPVFAAGSPPPPSDTPAGVASPSSTSSDTASSSQLAGAPRADDSGKHAPLARQKAADWTATGDPRWCPSGVAPHNGGGCSPGFASLSDLVAGFFPHANGTIWIEKGPDSGLEVNIIGSGTWFADQAFSLTLQGGWKGTLGSTALAKANPYDPYPYSSFSHAINIVDWVGPVKINNITLQFVGANVYAPGTAALNVQTKGAITLNRVLAKDAGSGLSGAILQDFIGPGTPVSVQNSMFVFNSAGGLSVLSAGSITLKNIVADFNQGDDGVFVNNTFAAVANTKSVTISNGEFRGNIPGSSDGLDVLSNGAVKLSNLTASGNGSDGAFVVNGCPLCGSPVSITGVNNFSNNLDDGLFLITNGAIQLSNTTANFNAGGGDGVFLNNGGLHPAQPVKISGYLTAMGNDGDGLFVVSDGLVSAANLTANSNASDGAFINAAAVKLTGKNTFNNNVTGDGLFIVSKGAVALSNLTAIGNGYLDGAFNSDVTGVFINNAFNPSIPSPVIVSGKSTFNNNTEQGLFLLSFGPVTLSNLTAVGNGLGVLDGSGSGVRVLDVGNSPKPIMIKGTNLFNGSDQYGLWVVSNGPITVSRITATSNRWAGAFLNNKNTSFQSKVTITGYGMFLGNGSDLLSTNDEGLLVKSNGAITLANITASYNYGDGAELDTEGLNFGGPQGVTLSGKNTFNLNGVGSLSSGSGLGVNADGNIKVNNITASYNNGFGAFLDNRDNWLSHGNPSFGFGSVTVTGYGKFFGNSSALVSGIAAVSHGSVTLNHVTASFNAGFVSDGIFIDADGNAKLVCSSTIGTVGSLSSIGLGVVLGPTHTLTLLGFTSAGNGLNEDFTGGFAVVTKPCP